jgi:hypothetical protein
VDGSGDAVAAVADEEGDPVNLYPPAADPELVPCRGTVSAGAAEALNNKGNLVKRKPYGFRTAEVAKPVRLM